MKLFITGGSGVIGRRAIPAFEALGHEVIAPRRHELDLFDAGAVTAAVRGCDVVINLATSVPSPPARALLPGAWRSMDRIRRDASRIIADATRGSGSVHTLIQESFAPIYESAGADWITEESPVRAARYNRSTLDAESNALTFAGGKAIVLRFALFYGPHDSATEQLLESVRKGRFMMFGDPNNYFTYVHHDDAASAVVAALTADGGIYNVAENEPLRRRDLAEGLARTLGVEPPKFLPRFASKLAGSVGETLSREQRISNAKLRTTGWTARHDNMPYSVS
ncbi:MAG TPA: NAD(P)-dependent oxidoreductase [Longimicrobiales bacterium]|nr:NAD(P)-dependent oxidoreductase [Longimicrobiales bacterium]